MYRNTLTVSICCLLVTLLTAGSKLLTGQQLLDDSFIKSMYKDVRVLTADSLEGREAGTMGELLAALYIAERLEKMNVAPLLDDCYYQDFIFSDGYEYPEEKNYLKVSLSSINKSSTKVVISLKDYTPLPWGADGTVNSTVEYAGYSIEGFFPDNESRIKRNVFRRKDNKSDNLEGKIFLVRYDKPENYDNDVSIVKLMSDKVVYAEKMGAVAVIFYDPNNKIKRVPANYLSYETEQAGIPIIFIHDKKQLDLIKDATIELTVKSEEKRSFGKNVIGFINNNAEQTIVIGAHYDHLGYGSYLSRNPGLPAIHPGADDNASGVAGILALAEWLSESDLKGKNYIFVAFSAEEKGLVGSREFVSMDRIDSEKVFAMLNFDMIGRVDREEPKISLFGAGSSPKWKEILSFIDSDVKGVPVEGGITGSDHYHFYENRIPVLFFFSGIHEDYHKPSDVIDKINFQGMRNVMEYSINLLHILDTLKSLPFTEVDQDNQRRSRRTDRVSLGIVPGHGVDVTGVMVDDVIRNRPASEGGMRKGDIIINIDGNDIRNIMQYMRVLDNINEGQKIEVIVIRNNEPLTLFLQL